MSIDTSFKPTAATIPLSTTPIQVSQVGGPGAITTYRVRCLAAGPAYFSWGPTSAQATANAALAVTGLAAGTPLPATIGMFASTTEVFELPAGSFIVSSVVAAFEFTPGQGA